MSQPTVSCEQAIFTSVRTPGSEGYRIIAASRGLKPEERQVITRSSPSHDAIAQTRADAAGFACYPLPGGRLCFAHSSYAGAEHTGRGGRRVYTLNVVISPEHFACFRFNHFAVFRAMKAANLLEPQLKPPQTLPQAQLQTASDGVEDPVEFQDRGWLENVGVSIVHRLMHGQKVVVAADGDTAAIAAAVFTGIPGPRRLGLSFGAGLKFSLSRSCHLNVTTDDGGQTKLRITGQPIEWVGPGYVPPRPQRSAWLDFVARGFAAAPLDQLERRTARAFEDCGDDAVNRIATLYEAIDQTRSDGFDRLVGRVREHLGRTARGVEGEIVGELLGAAQKAMSELLLRATRDEIERYWSLLLPLWRQGGVAGLFAERLTMDALDAWSANHPLLTARLGLAALTGASSSEAKERATKLGIVMLNRLAGSIAFAPADDIPALRQVAGEWARIAEASTAARTLQEALTRRTSEGLAVGRSS